MHPAVPFAGQHSARPHLSGRSVQVHRALAGIFGWSRTIEKTSALDIQIAETLGLKPIGQNTKQDGAAGEGTVAAETRCANGPEAKQRRDRVGGRSRRQAYSHPAAPGRPSHAAFLLGLFLSLALAVALVESKSTSAARIRVLIEWHVDRQ